MSDEGPPLGFVAAWGLFAIIMLFGQAQMINHGANIAMSYQLDEGSGPTMMAALD